MSVVYSLLRRLNEGGPPSFVKGFSPGGEPTIGISNSSLNMQNNGAEFVWLWISLKDLVGQKGLALEADMTVQNGSGSVFLGVHGAEPDDSKYPPAGVAMCVDIAEHHRGGILDLTDRHRLCPGVKCTPSSTWGQSARYRLELPFGGLYARATIDGQEVARTFCQNDEVADSAGIVLIGIEGGLSRVSFSKLNLWVGDPYSVESLVICSADKAQPLEKYRAEPTRTIVLEGRDCTLANAWDAIVTFQPQEIHLDGNVVVNSDFGRMLMPDQKRIGCGIPVESVLDLVKKLPRQAQAFVLPR